MKYGVNLMLFGDTVTPAVLRQFPRLKAMGFDGVEIPVFAPAKIAAGKIRAEAERHGLGLTASGALPPGTRFYGRASAPRRAAERYVRGCIRTLRDLGAPVICGPLYKAVGDTDESAPLATQRRETAKAMRPLAREAEEAGVTLAFEPLNRFETNFMNTVAQGVDFCQQIDSPSAGLLLDTFHMHIEEKRSASAIRAATRAGVLAHLHASENDRGVAGSGQVAWTEVAEAIGAAAYDRWCVLESFSQTVKEIRTAVSCWRPFYPTTDAFCCAGLAFVKKLFGDDGR